MSAGGIVCSTTAAMVATLWQGSAACNMPPHLLLPLRGLETNMTSALLLQKPAGPTLAPQRRAVAACFGRRAAAVEAQCEGVRMQRLQQYQPTQLCGDTEK